MNPRYFIIAQNDLLAQELTGHVLGGTAAVAHGEDYCQCIEHHGSAGL
jgi:hypothetical protein